MLLMADPQGWQLLADSHTWRQYLQLDQQSNKWSVRLQNHTTQGAKQSNWDWMPGKREQSTLPSPPNRDVRKLPTHQQKTTTSLSPCECNGRTGGNGSASIAWFDSSKEAASRAKERDEEGMNILGVSTTGPLGYYSKSIWEELLCF